VQYDVLQPELAKLGSTIILNELTNRLKARGMMDTLQFVKLSRNACMRHVLGKPLQSVSGVALKDGWPIWLIPLKELTRSENGLRALLTLLTLTRAFTHSAGPDLSTISDKWTGKDTISSRELHIALSVLGIRKQSVGDWKTPHMSTKRGPQGQAILTSLTETTLLPQQLIEDINLLGGSSLATLIRENLEALDILEIGPSKYNSVATWWRALFPPKSTNLRKLSYFPDKEGKTRVIAIFDYWSQSALRPLHLAINKMLKRIPNDCTYNQGNFHSSSPAVLPDGHSYHSIDLSAATDRMPAALQKRVVQHIYGSIQKGDAWLRILVGQAFTVRTPDKVVHTVKYAAGQPMGAYSSWPVMALTHHVIVQVSALRAGLIKGVNPNHRFKGYFLLGDDLRIDHDLVAKEYKALISELGMPYSEAKTHTSKDGFEFAKRWFFQGKEITGFSISGLMSVWKSYPLLMNFLDNQGSHGWVLPESRHPSLILAIHRVLHGKYLIFNKVNSMIKLYGLFYHVRYIKSHNVNIDSLVCHLRTFVGATLFANLSNQQIQDIVNLMYLRAKRNLVEKDLLYFQKEAYRVNAKLWGFVKKHIKGAGVDSATANFLLETVSTVLNWNSPLVLCLNALIDQSQVFLMNYWDPEISDDFLFESGLSKYRLSKGTFSMRNSVSVSLAESAILKEFLTVVRDYHLEKGENFTAIEEKLQAIRDNT